MSARNCSRSSACQRETPAGRRGFAVRSATNRGRFVARTCAGRRTFDGSFMCAPIGGRNGPVGAHPRKDGALLERWRAQCGAVASLYRNRRCRVFAAGTRPSQRILDASHRFPEPCGHVGPQPSPKHVAGEPMKSSSSPSPPSPEAVIPTSCPACQSSTIVTTAKSPDADSYWRCEHCGEVWNASRSQTDRYRGRRLR